MGGCRQGWGIFYNFLFFLLWRHSPDNGPKLWGISLINIQKFGHNFWNRNARKFIKPFKDSYCSLESIKTLSHKIGSIGHLPGDDDVIQI